MKKILCTILTSTALCSPAMTGGKGRAHHGRKGMHIPQQQNRALHNKLQRQMNYTPSFNFYAPQGSAQGALFFGGTVPQVAAASWAASPSETETNMMDIESSLGGMGEIASRTNDIGGAKYSQEFFRKRSKQKR